MATVDTRQYTTGIPESQHEGVTPAIFRISLSLSQSIGDVHRIGKIPHGAIPLDAVLIPATAWPANSAIAKFGTSASNDLFFASATVSAAGLLYRCARTLGLTQQISLSDDKMPRYEAITMVVTGTALSVGYMADLIVYYRLPGQTFNPG